MKYKTSFFNMAIVLEDFKRLWGLAALYFLMVFFTGPFEIMMRIGNSSNNISYMVQNFLSYRYMEFQVIYSIIFAILLSMLIYRYLHTINSTTVLHSFPITRKELFHSHNLAGIVIMLIPVILNVIILLILMMLNNDGSLLYQEVFTIQEIMTWMGKTMLLNVVIYLIATITAMITGTSIIQGVLSCVFIFLPIGLGTLIMVNLDQLIYGFALNNNSMEKFLVKIIPVVQIISNSEITTGLVFWYLLLSVGLYVLALYFYRNRHLEKATDPISIDGLKPIFKYGVTFSAMVLGGAYFYSLERIDAWLYIGYILGGYLGCLIADMLVQKTLWVFKNIKGFLIYSIIIIIAFVGVKMDLTGFEGRIPEMDNIESAYYGYGLYSYRNGNKEALEELENIELVRKLHQNMVENKEKYGNNKGMVRTNTVGIAYELKNGKSLYREYEVPIEDVRNNPIVANIFETEEYKRKYHSIFKINPTEIDYIQLESDYYHINKNIKIIDDKAIEEIIEVMKKDVLEESYEDSFSNLVPWGRVSFISEKTMELEPMNFHFTWKKHDENLSKWLKDKGYYENIRVMPEDIDYMVVEKKDEVNDEPVQSTKEWEGHGSNHIEIRDKEKIEDLLYNHERHSVGEEKYLLGIYFKNGTNDLGVISEDRLPQDIKNALN